MYSKRGAGEVCNMEPSTDTNNKPTNQETCSLVKGPEKDVPAEQKIIFTISTLLKPKREKNKSLSPHDVSRAKWGARLLSPSH